MWCPLALLEAIGMAGCCLPVEAQMADLDVFSLDDGVNGKAILIVR
jgi:hypothetical protein